MSQEESSRVKLQTSQLSVAMAVLLVLAKGAVGLFTGSIAILASSLDSLLDVCSSSVNMFSIRASIRPADEEHPWGHGKAESLSGLFQGLLIQIR